MKMRGRTAAFLRYEGKEKREQRNDFHVKKGEGLFLPRIFFPLSLFLFLIFSRMA